MNKKSLIIIFFILIFCFNCSYLYEQKEIYLVITTGKFLQSPALATFISFRESDFDVQVVNGAGIGTTPEQFREYVRNLRPSYVLLVGAYGDFPTYKIQFGKKNFESYNYYIAASTTGHPNPDIPLGLFMVENEGELGNIVNKTIYTENNLSSLPKKYYAHAGSKEPLDPWPLKFNEEILTEMYNKYFSPRGYAFKMATAADDTPNDALTDINAINNGVGYVVYHGHGAINKWAFGLGVGGLPQLNNTIYPFILSFCCATGSFSGTLDGGPTLECYAVKMVASQHGAVAFIGAYNSSGKGQNPLLEGLCNAIANAGIDRLGDALIYGFNNKTFPDTVNKYYPVVTEEERTRSAWQFHLFGDPALKIR